MNKIAFALVFSLLTVAAFGQKVKQVKGDDYGDGIKAKTYVTYDDMFAQLNTKDTVDLTVRAKVDEVCQAKGCWMTLSADGHEAMMVRFKDYGFFVPKDIGGKEVIIEGQAFATEVSVAELRHYAEDAGKSEEEIMKITEPEKQFAFLASGVRVLN